VSELEDKSILDFMQILLNCCEHIKSYTERKSMGINVVFYSPFAAFFIYFFFQV